MNRTLALLAVSLAVVSAPAYADSVTLTFSGIGDGAPVGNYYNGGAGGSLGIQFSSDATALVSKLDGGNTNFSDEPSPGTDAALGFLSDNGIMNVADGFTSGLGLSFTSIGIASDIVAVWSGPNATGTLLALSDLSPTGSNCGTLIFSCWSSTEIDFAGTAESVAFVNPANLTSMLFTDITIDTTSPTLESSPVPEPCTFTLIGTGILGFAGAARRKFSSTVNRRTPMRLRLLVVAVLLFGVNFCAKADTLIQITSGTLETTSAPTLWGQSFTIPGSGQFNDITFNFFDSQGNPLAAGKGYLFSSPYTGFISDLNFNSVSQLSNFIGFANSSGGVYTFLPFVFPVPNPLVLDAGTTYYFYEDEPLQQLSGGATYAGGVISMAGGGSPFFENTALGLALNFEVTGTPIMGDAPGITPEPSSLLLLGTGILGLAAATRRKLLHSW